MFRVPERCKTNGLDFQSHEVDLDHSPVSGCPGTLCCWPDGSQFPGKLNELEKTQMKSLVVLLMDKILHHQG